MPVYKLSAEGAKIFPPARLADFDGLLAYGGDLCIERLVNAYSNGIFPWFNPEEEILWWAPKMRFVIFPSEIKISRSLKKLISSGELETRFNFDFPAVINSCGELRAGKTWLGKNMQAAYIDLFNAGHALSAGVYKNDELVGGLYGVALGKCFFGESMFSLVPSASKVALVALAERLKAEGFLFIDCQFHTPHLESMGGRYISWDEYHRLLREGRRDFSG